jgi:hypothetical protein
MRRFFTTIYHRLLRDYLAGQALAGLCANGAGTPDEHDARLAYELADAMLLAREGKKDHQVQPDRLRIAPF